MQVLGAKKKEESRSTAGRTCGWGPCVEWVLWWALPKSTPLCKCATCNRVSVRGIRDRNIGKRQEMTEEAKGTLSKDGD